MRTMQQSILVLVVGAFLNVVAPAKITLHQSTSLHLTGETSPVGTTFTSRADIVFNDASPSGLLLDIPEISTSAGSFIDDAIAEAAHDGWDGPGSYGVALDTRVRAERIASLLPSFLPHPDIWVTPSGSIAFTWEKGPTCQLSILASRSGGVSFAAYFAGDRVHGAMRLEPNRLPQEILAAADRWNAAGGTPGIES